MKFKKTKLGDLCDISSSKRIFAKEYVDKGIPFYRSKEIILKHNNQQVSDPLYISIDRYNEIKGKHGAPKEGDILLTSVGTLGIPYIVKSNEEFYFKDGNLTWLKNFKSNVNNKFIYYWLQSKYGKNEINRITIGSTQQAITINSLKSLEIYLPPFKNQNRICQILDALYDKEYNNLKIIKHLELLAQTLFKHWFVDFEFPNEEGKPYKSSGGKMVESELGMIPEKWELSTLGLFSNEMKNGGTPNRKNESYWLNGKIPWLKTKEIKNNYIIEAEEFITQEGLEGSSAKLLSKDTILIAMYGATAGQLGFLKFESTTNQACCAVITDYPNYVYSFLIRNQEYIKSLSTGSAQQNLSKEILSNLKIVMPNYNILNKFEKNISFISSKIEALLKENRVLEALLDTLLPRLLSGEIELQDDLGVTDDVPIS